jgi:hypothetical protein
MKNGERRALDSFPPFRADEMIEQRYEDKDGKVTYAYFPRYAGRLRAAREKYPDLKITTKLVKGDLRQHAIVYAAAVATITSPIDNRQLPARGSGYGTADKQGDGRLADSLIELAETRAITRALRTLGIGTEYNGAEEVGEGRAAYELDAVRAQPEAPNRASAEPLVPGGVRDRLWNRLMNEAKQDLDTARKMLLWLTGAERPSQLNELQARCGLLAADLVSREGGGKEAKARCEMAWGLPWFDKMTEPQYLEALEKWRELCK